MAVDTPRQLFKALLAYWHHGQDNPLILPASTVEGFGLAAVGLLQRANLLRDGGEAKTVICDGCFEACPMEVQFAPPARPTMPPRALIVCDKEADLGIIRVEPWQLKQYQARWEDWLAWLAGQLQTNTPAQEWLTDHLWDLGFCEAVGCHLFVAKGSSWPGLVKVSASKSTQWMPYRNPIILTTHASIEEQQVGLPLCLPLVDLIGCDDKGLTIRINQLQQTLVHVAQHRAEPDCLLLIGSTQTVYHFGQAFSLKPSHFTLLKLILECPDEVAERGWLSVRYRDFYPNQSDDIPMDSYVSAINRQLIGNLKDKDL